MRLDTATLLHLLAHELRSPAGVAGGYLRLIRDGRLPAADVPASLDRAMDAVTRIADLTDEASHLANLLEHRSAGSPGPSPTLAASKAVGAGRFLDMVLARVEAQARVSLVRDAGIDDTTEIGTADADVLADAVAALIVGAARETPERTLAAQARRAAGDPPRLCLAVGPASRLAALLAGPAASGAGGVAPDRGGMGLALITAMLVLDAHGGTVWTLTAVPGTCAMYLPLTTGPGLSARLG